MTREAWFCPSCQKHHAPHVETCPAPVDLIGKDRMPALPSIPPPYWSQPSILPDLCAGCKGPCGNVACPKLPKVTYTKTSGSVSFPFDPNAMIIN